MVGFFHDDEVKVRDRVNAIDPTLAIDHVAVGASHTHEAPDSLGQWGPIDPRGTGVPTG